MRAKAPAPSNYLGGLTGLRALAALAVFGVHLEQLVPFYDRIGPIELSRLLPNGNHGVSLFFTLSGFLLSLPFWRGRLGLGPKPKLKVYAARRLARILPAYWVSLTVLLLLSGLWRHPEARTDILLHYGFVFNYAEFSIFSINAPYWTLAVEVQFYFLLPLVFLLFRRARLLWSLLAVAVTAGAFYGMHCLVVSSVDRIIPWPGDARLRWVHPYGAVLSHSLLAHMPHFLIGVMFARLYLSLKDGGLLDRSGTKTAAEVIFWGSLAAALFLLGTDLNDRIQIVNGRYGLPLVPLILAAAVLAAPVTRGARSFLESFPVKSLGVISYGFYIWHVPCLNHLDQFLRQHDIDAAEGPAWLLLAGGGFLLTVVISTISYFLVEKPILRLAHRVR